MAEPSNNGSDERNGDGTFAQGNRCGHGRPAGSRNGVTIALDEIAATDGTDVLRRLLTAAKSGDTQAATVVLSRIWPVRRGRPVHVNLPRVETAQDISAAMSVLIAAATSGELTPQEAASLTALLDAKRQAIEAFDFEARIKALEDAQEAGKCARD